MPEPERVTNAANKETLIFQVGWAGINLGRVDFVLNKKTRKKLGFGNPVKIS
jgi:5'-nucleotidase